jgi:hypothetical protein
MMIGATKTTARPRIIPYKPSGASSLTEAQVSQMGKTATANEKSIAAHLRKSKSPIPVSVAAKKKTETGTIAPTGKAPSCRHIPTNTKTRNASKTNVAIPNALIAPALIKKFYRPKNRKGSSNLQARGEQHNVGLQQRRAISIQDDGKRSLEKHAIAPSAARLCYARRSSQ